jgi:hypothetical protein
MPTLTFTNTLTNGQANDADEVMANFNNVGTLVNSTLLDEDNIKYFYSDVYFTVTADFVEDNKTAVYYLKPRLDNGQLEPQRVGMAFDGVTGAVTATLDVQRDSGSGFVTILGSTISEATADTFETTDSFIGSPNIANNDGIKFILTTSNTAGGSDGISNVTIWMQCKVKHRE